MRKPNRCVTGIDLTSPLRCAVNRLWTSARVQLPAGNWFAPPGSTTRLLRSSNWRVGRAKIPEVMLLLNSEFRP
jgi:hypothetical protein